MKLTFLSILIFTLQVSASVYSQTKKLDLSLSNVSVKEVFRTIEAQSDFRFFYNDELSDVNRLVTIDLENMKVEDILGKLFDKSRVTYKVLDNNLIVITPIGLVNQKQTVSGTVTDVTTNEPIPGVNVTVEGTTLGTVTDNNGKYTIDLPSASSVLLFSFVGYNTERMITAAGSKLDVSLIPDIKKLDEIIVVGYGTQKKRDIIGSVSTVKSDDLNVKGTSTFDAGLQGLAAGVSVQSSSGVPGAATKIKIRGMNSINSSTDPLWIVDGMPIITWSGAQNSGTTDQSPMSLINANDIESIQVLKDAAATAIYGSRASNGVILITTKSGKQGKGTTTIDYSTGISDLSRKPSDIGYANTEQWFQMNDLAYANSGKTFDLNEYYRLSPMAFTTITREQAEATNTDWYNKLFRKGSFQDINLSSSRGSDKANYFVSLNYRKDEGVQLNNSMERYTGRANIDFYPTNNLTVGAKLNFSYSKNNRMQNTSYRGGSSANGGLNAITTSALPWFPIYDPADPSKYFNPYSGSNPMAYADTKNLIDELNLYRGMGGLSVEYKLPFIKGLSIRSEGSFDMMQTNNIFWQSKYIHLDGSSKPNSYASDQAVTLQNLNYNAFATYTKEVGEHDFNFVFGTEASRSKVYSRQSTAQNLTGTFQELGNPGQMLNMWGGISGETYLLSFFGRANYKFKNKYLLGLSARRDGTSTFTPENRWGTFLAFSAGWMLSDEAFMSFLGNRTTIKLRGSYGETGNSNISKGLDKRNYMGGLMYGGNSIMGLNGTLPSNIPVGNLTWESTKSSDVGIDFGFFDNRINGSLAYYNKYVTNMLLPGPIPFSSGVGGGPYDENAPIVMGNLGNMTNSGFEIDIHSNNISEGKFRWSTDFNIAFNRNKINSLTPEADQTGKGLITDTYLSRKGDMRYQWFFASYAGVDPNTGVPMIYSLDKDYYNQTGDTRVMKTVSGADSLTYGTKANIAANKFIQKGKSPDPTYFGGITNTFEFMGFDLSFLVSFSGGNYIYDYDEQLSTWVGASKNFKSDMIGNVWTKPGDIAKYPQPRFGNTYIIDGKAVADFGDEWVRYNRCLYKGDYIRLKNLQLGYNFPSTMTSKLKLQGIRVYVSGTNLWTKTQYPGFDPEGAEHVYTATIPQLKSVIFGVNVKF